MTPPDPRLDLEGLYRTHRNEVYRASLRKLGDHHDAEDVTQTAFLDAYKAILRGSQPDLPRPWLLAIAENVRRRRFRTALRRPREEPLRDESLPSAEPPWRAQTEEIRTALARLGESQRKVFLLRELGGFSYGEIASELDLSVPAVQMLLFRARQKLRLELDRSGSIRLGGLIPVPHWLLGLGDRFAAGFPAPRVAGLVAASVLAAGVGVSSDISDAGPNLAPAEQGQSKAKVASSAHVPVKVPALKARTSQARTVAVGAKRDARAARTKASLTNGSVTKGSVANSSPATPAAVPELSVGESSAEPAAPIAPPAILGKDGPAPALALVPALPPVSQAPIEAVVGALLPPLPEPPVEEGVPALPDVSIVVQPPLLPALPGGVEVTVPAVPGLRVGP